jgi:4-alpha-glucanotransferase
MSLANPGLCSPYSPSHRLLLNPVYADPCGVLGIESGNDAGDTAALIDWPSALAGTYAALRAAHASVRSRPDVAAALESFRRERGRVLEHHARFELLQALQAASDPALADWRRWPPALQRPDSPETRRITAQHPEEVDFYIFAQWLAERSLAHGQEVCRRTGLRIGLIADLAVGTDPGGSHAWSHRDEMLDGLTVGAPPDLFNADGQDWGLTAFAARGLAGRGYGPWLDLLRATLRHTGGIRIDHILGLKRRWIIPAGAGAGEGVYLNYPFDDLLALAALEGHRHRAVVIGEDLGTVPEGFRDRLAAAGVLGIDVLMFSNDGDGYRPASAWSADAAAMTSTHDLPPLAAWWRGTDLDVQQSLGRLPDPAAARRERDSQRSALWRVVGDGEAPEPSADFVDAAIAHVARTPAALALVPLEDVLGLEQQPNLPGTLDEHPNWRRRMAADAASLLAEPRAAARLALLRAERGG